MKTRGESEVSSSTTNSSTDIPVWKQRLHSRFERNILPAPRQRGLTKKQRNKLKKEARESA
jgi:hypothetical protein